MIGNKFIGETMGLQSVRGRLWDVLWMFRCAINTVAGDLIKFCLHVHNNESGLSVPLVRLKGVCDTGGMN